MMKEFIPYGRQEVTEEDIAAVVDVLRSDWLTQGQVVPQFENAISTYCHSKYAVAVSNGTAALHLACLALGVGQGDIVWTSPISFVASANCALYCGATIDFVDIDKNTLNMSIEALEKKLIAAKKNDSLPKVIIPVHFGGLSCDMKAIHALSEQYGFRIIEDACHAIGGRYQDKPIGSCQYSDIAVFSFHPVKVITTGEGGALTTNNKEIFDKLTLLRTHGISRDPNFLQHKNNGPWYYEQLTLGYNCRITDFQCALGLSQLKRLDDYVARRNELASHYNNQLSSLSINKQYVSKDCYSAYHLNVVWLNEKDSEKTRLKIFNEMRDSNVGVNVHYIPIHLQPYYQKMGFKEGDFPIAEAYYKSALTLPLFPGMQNKDVDYIVKSLEKAVIGETVT